MDLLPPMNLHADIRTSANFSGSSLTNLGLAATRVSPLSFDRKLGDPLRGNPMP
jgi:hypothetical protein